MNRTTLLIACALATACTVAPPRPADLSPGPQLSRAQGEQAARRYIAEKLRDPGRVEDVTLTRDPYPTEYQRVGKPWVAGYVVCFEYDVRNRASGRVGEKLRAIVVRGGAQPEIVDVLEDPYPIKWC